MYPIQEPPVSTPQAGQHTPVGVLLPFILNLVIIGAGDVVRRKLWLALLALGLRLRVAICGMEPVSHLNSMPHDYFSLLPGDRLPLSELFANGYGGPRTLVIVATPSQFHVHYVLQALALGARVATEKPLDADSKSAGQLRPFCHQRRVYGIDHFLFKEDFVTLNRLLGQNPGVLADLARIEITYHETPGFNVGRHQEEPLGDMQYHCLSLAKAVLQCTGQPFSVAVNNATVATHRPDPNWAYAIPQVPTASRVAAHAESSHGHRVELDLRQAKGAPANVKGLRLLDRHANVIAEADLSESGHQAHGRVLQQLLAKRPDLRLNLADHLEVMELVDAARRRVQNAGFHNFAQLPQFLE